MLWSKGMPGLSLDFSCTGRWGQIPAQSVRHGGSVFANGEA
jgi:hypothetical protein